MYDQNKPVGVPDNVDMPKSFKALRIPGIILLDIGKWCFKALFHLAGMLSGGLVGLLAFLPDEPSAKSFFFFLGSCSMLATSAFWLFEIEGFSWTPMRIEMPKILGKWWNSVVERATR